MSVDRMLFYDNIRKDENVDRASRICEAIENKGPFDSFPSPEILKDYYDLQRSLLRTVTSGDPSLSYWQNYVLGLTADSENTFSLRSESADPDELTLRFAQGDIEEIQKLLRIDWKTVSEEMEDSGLCVCAVEAVQAKTDERISLLNMALKDSPEQAVKDVAKYYRRHMCGLLGRYRVFVWDGQLRGVENPDPITFDDLVGYESQKKQLIRNTEMFLDGRRANNALLYGDKGTGKSSSVKALINKFRDKGLRMISMPKDRIFDITKVMDGVSGRGCRFIIFIDDLSFEETEIEYKKFKSVLDGGVEIQPSNVLVYVTSNRRNLVKEMWSDRGDSGEIHASDGIQERQSLADRFGLTITFPEPGKRLYDDIVLSIAKREGVDIDERQLLDEANKWDMRQTSRSGRSARQFITNISGR